MLSAAQSKDAKRAELIEAVRAKPTCNSKSVTELIKVVAVDDEIVGHMIQNSCGTDVIRDIFLKHGEMIAISEINFLKYLNNEFRPKAEALLAEEKSMDLIPVSPETVGLTLGYYRKATSEACELSKDAKATKGEALNPKGLARVCDLKPELEKTFKMMNELVARDEKIQNSTTK